ncbi:uncharacterized protein MYCFIDRAFT_187714 [Pseudocercospora fijiensis CIRAD86]|uniref:Uncharacterized protein n=1 Tax=Pseudocercospora fijiensis (strain CIRAD86) TaxID=383855 RepID=M3AJX1_PSEFD|nr:uncharacterized protein MYCFIDRAFT_187714 [Pseudocercospora fijiensis CIRAD86]EME84871.1 hypothetical protein MYCFIDRAFT_187714 [Pseudocercospora fijiensis CIRAD86]
MVILRPPTFSTAKPPADFETPLIEWLAETWHVTHSTLPMWKSKRNVRIQYTPLEPSVASISADNTDRLDDLVTYQSLNGEKVSKVKGIDKAAGSGVNRGEWDWRGKGWLKVASSHWEVLGWGEEANNGNNKWVVTMFAKTLFTPAGIDVYSRSKEGLLHETLEEIKMALASIDDSGIGKLSEAIFEIKVDSARMD